MIDDRSKDLYRINDTLTALASDPRVRFPSEDAEDRTLNDLSHAVAEAFGVEPGGDPGAERHADLLAIEDAVRRIVAHGMSPSGVREFVTDTLQAMAERSMGDLYEKCAHCHLFIEPNDAGDGFAPYVHLHRGDDADEAIDESHDAEPSGMRATLDTWKAYGPAAMRERFTEAGGEA